MKNVILSLIMIGVSLGAFAQDDAQIGKQSNLALLPDFEALYNNTKENPKTVEADELDCDDVKAKWSQLKQTIKEWKDKPENFVPDPPPVFQFDCYGETSRQQRDARQIKEVGEFGENYFTKESKFFVLIRSIAPQVEACNIATKTEVLALSEDARDIIKARTLIQMNQIRGFASPGKFDYYYGAIVGTYYAERNVSMLGDEFPEIKDVRVAMLQELIDHLSEQLVLSHDLQITPKVFIHLLRSATILGLVDSECALEMLDRIFGYYRFQIDFDEETRLGNGDPLLMKFIKRNPVDDTPSKYSAFVQLPLLGELEPNSKLRYQPQEMHVGETGTGSMEEGSLAYLQPGYYVTDLNFELFPCEEGNPNVSISISRFGADGESWRLCDDDGNCFNLPKMAESHIVALSILRHAKSLKAEAPWPEAIYSPMSPPLAFTFEVPLTNKVEKIVDWEMHDQIESDGQAFFEQLKWKIFHKPKLVPFKNCMVEKPKN